MPDGAAAFLDPRTPKLILLLGLSGIGLYLCYRLTLPFVPAITLALVLAVILAPAHHWLQARLGNASLAAALLVTMAAAVVLLVLVFVVQQLAREAAGGAAYLETRLRTFDLRMVIGSHSQLANAVAWIEQRFDPAGALGALAQWLTAQSTMLLRGSVGQVISLVLAFYLLFYFLRDHEAALRGLARFSPFEPSEMRLLVGRFADTIHATIFGTMTVAAIQGALGGLMFWALGLPMPVFWGLIMGLLAVVPVLGAFVVWIPGALFLALEGEWLSALVLAIWGGVVIATIDNLIYPVLVGERLKLHTVATLIGAIGGMILFGPSGLVLGPATIAVTQAMVEILQARFRWNASASADVEAESEVAEAHRPPMMIEGSD